MPGSDSLRNMEAEVLGVGEKGLGSFHSSLPCLEHPAMERGTVRVRTGTLNLEAPGDRYLCPTRQVHPSLARSSTPRLPFGHQLLSCSSLKGRIPVWTRHDNGGIEAPDGMMLARVLPSCTKVQLYSSK